MTETGLSKQLRFKQTGLAARVAQAKNTQPEIFDPLSKTNRIGLVIDDSASMGMEGMAKAREAVEAFIKNCNSADTAIAIYPLNADPQSLANDFALVGIYASTIQATGMTPLYDVLNRMLEREPITRAVAFSDGEPNGHVYEEDTVKLYIEKKVPIDTIYIGRESDSGYQIMKSLADKTGGIFLHFTDASVLSKSLKYLSPRLRYMLENAELKGKIQKGEL